MGSSPQEVWQVSYSTAHDCGFVQLCDGVLLVQEQLAKVRLGQVEGRGGRRWRAVMTEL